MPSKNSRMSASSTQFTFLRQQPDHRARPARYAGYPRPETVREAQEVGLVDGVEHLDDGPLDDLVLQRGNAQRPLPPVRLRDVHSRERLRSVRSRVSAARTSPGGWLRGPARSAATSRRRPPAPRLSSEREGRPQAVESSTWCRSAVNRCLLVPSCRFTYPLQRTGRAVPALCPGRVLLARVSLGQAPSLHPSAAGGPALFGGFVGTTGLSDFPSRSSSAYGHWPSRRGPRGHTPAGDRDLPVLAQEIPCMLGVSDRAGSACGSRYRCRRCGLPPCATASAPRMT